MLSWTNPAARVTDNFVVRECCWLPSWGVMHVPDSHEQANLIKTCLLLEKVRALVGKPVRVHCMIRPRVTSSPGGLHDGQDYNSFVGGAPQSAHVVGLAADFDVPGMSCDDLRELLFPHLEALGCRMENSPHSAWVHLDLRAPGPGGRYFKP